MAFGKKGTLKLKFRRQRAFKLRFRRHLRLQKRQVEEFGVQAEQRLEDDFFKRLERLGRVKRFMTAWLLLVVLLIGVVVAQTRSLSGYYQVLAPAPGGTYTEGVLGAFTNANPVYATGLANATVSELVFAGLVTYDHKNRLVGDLAESWSVDKTGTNYTVRLKPALSWHDGEALTAEDVVFTYQVIQNPDAGSPLFDSWNNIKVSAPDERTVVFALPNPLASFPYSLTTGIIPEHILGGVPMSNMRSVSFNSTQPVGAGPFQWQALELSGSSVDKRQEKVALKAFEHYHAGKPKLNGFVVRTFRDAEQLVASFQEQEVMGIAGLTQLPDALSDDYGARIYHLPLTASVMAFFRTQDGLLANAKLRKALVLSADRQSIIESLQYPTRPMKQPLLPGQVGYDATYNQEAYDPGSAVKILREEGWKVGGDAIRAKGSTPLEFSLYFLDSVEYTSVANQLADQWKAVGVRIKLMPQNEADFKATLSSAPSPGNPTYDILLYGISIGPDPDVYAFWHSSQIDLRSAVRLNFSEYKSSTADTALEAGRTRLDPALRAVKYRPFLAAWKNDAPALGLYQARFLYITRGPIHGLTETPINTDAGRLTGAHNWQIRQELVTP
jgi:peptide/nickel transport system substrate-binding protein